MKKPSPGMHKLAKIIAPKIIEAAFINGDLEENDFIDREKLLNKLKKKLPKNDKDLFFTILHYDSLLNKAKKAVNKKEWEYAYVFYATYFEHFINEIISIWGAKHKKPFRFIKELIRKVNIEDKYTWLLDILELPKFNSKHFKTIKKLSEKRNAFIHYKYEPVPADESIDKELNEWRGIQSFIKGAVTYSKRYRNKIVWGGKKEKFNENK